MQPNTIHSHIATLLSNCIKTKNLNLGKNLHSILIKTSLIFDTFYANRLIHLYSICNSINCAKKAFDDNPFKNTHSWNTLISSYAQKGHFLKAHKLLDEMPEPNIVSYNSMISSFCRGGFFEEAVNVFKEMQRKERRFVFMDEFTVVGLANACSNLVALELLRQVHCVGVVMGLEFNVVVCNALIDAYAKCGMYECCFAIFNCMEERDVVSWTSTVVAYASACRMEEAVWVFERMPVKNTVSWTALITGLVRNGDGERALLFFTKMVEESIFPNDYTYVSALSACSDLALNVMGKQVHCHVLRNLSGSIFDNVFVVNALIDMYSKCGDMVSSTRLFDKLHSKDTVTWNSMINGLAQNGHGAKSLAVFDRMRRTNIKPNHATFIGILAACNHSGLECEALHFLEMMEHEFGLIPRSDHYSILVDLLGRKNKLVEALKVIRRASYGSDHMGMWGALLASCRVHGNLDIAIKAAEALFELEPVNTGRYVMLSNIYAMAGRWDEAKRVRQVVDGMDLKKEAGGSWIDIKNTRYMFLAASVFQCENEYIRELIPSIVDQMKDVGHVFLDEYEVT